MEEYTGENIPVADVNLGNTERIIQLTRIELQQMMEEAGRNAIVAYERRTARPIEKKAVKRKVFGGKEVERTFEMTSKKNPERSHRSPLEVGSSSRDKSHFRGPAISRAEVEGVSKMPDLPKYDRTRDPQEHLATFDLVMNLSIKSHEQLIQKFTFHFASKWKQKLSATHLFTIRQRDNETLKSFMGKFNNETLEVQDLRIDMMVSILIHGLRKGLFASALARHPPTDVEQLMSVAQKYIDEEEMNAMKDGERRISLNRGRDSRRHNSGVDRTDRRPRRD
ncbi:UNVERIFIED_CONTAM: hypothetical protein Sindi_2580300 [Sesamum indicum]